MNKILYKIKNNKLLSWFALGIILVVLFDLFVIVFDVCQFVRLKKNSIDRFGMFSEINIVAGVLNILAIVAVFIYLILRQKKIKAHVGDKSKSH